MSTPALELYGYQKRWIADRSRLKVGMMTRQGGKSFVATLEPVDDCMEAEAHGRKTKRVILSRGERQAKEAMIEGVHKHLAAYQLAANAFRIDEDIEYRIEDENGLTRVVRAQEVVFKGGSRILALPAAPDTARGFTANVLLDEFAFHVRSNLIWRAIFPVITKGFRVRVISTPNGKGNKFYELMTAGSSSWSRHICDIHQAIAEGLKKFDGTPVDAEELRLGLQDEDAWRQEYLLEWLDENSAWLSFELISSCEDESASIPEKAGSGQFFIGNDIARRSHLWVAWVLEKVGDVLWERERTS